MRLSTMLPVEYRLTIFNALLSLISYIGPVVWHMFSKSDTEKVEKVQEREHYVSYIENSTVIVNLY